MSERVQISSGTLIFNQRACTRHEERWKKK